MSIFQDAETACLDEEQGYTIRQLDQAVMDYYGFQHQLRKLAGECGELIGLLWLIREVVRRVRRAGAGRRGSHV